MIHYTDHKGDPQTMSLREFQSVRRAESWQHYAYDERPAYGDPVANTIYLMQNRFTNREIAAAVGTTDETVRELKREYRIRRSRAQPITKLMDQIIRSGLPQVRICEMTGLDDRVVKKYARINGIHITPLFRPYTDAELALFDVIKDNDELARRLGRDRRAISYKRRDISRRAKQQGGILAA